MRFGKPTSEFPLTDMGAVAALVEAFGGAEISIAGERDVYPPNRCRCGGTIESYGLGIGRSCIRCDSAVEIMTDRYEVLRGRKCRA